MTKWIVTEDNGSWTVTVKGRFKASKASESARNTWLKQNHRPGDKIILKEPDGFLRDITRTVLR